MCLQTTCFLRLIRALGFLVIYICGQTMLHAQSSDSAKKNEPVRQERNSIIGLSSGKMPVPVVIDLLSQDDESRLLATVTIMHRNYWQDHAIITAVTERLPQWNAGKQEVYLAVMPNIAQFLPEFESFSTLWIGLRLAAPQLLRDVAAAQMSNQPKAEIERIRQMHFMIDDNKSQDLIEAAAADAIAMSMRSFDQEKILGLLKSGGLYQKNIVLLYLDSNEPREMGPDLVAEIKSLAENSPCKSIALLAERLLLKHAKK
jgi:hypothetical protein